MGEWLRVGRFRLSSALVNAFTEDDICSVGSLMQCCLPIAVEYDAARSTYIYTAYSKLFDSVLLCEGETPPEYVMTLETNEAGQVLVKADRQ